MDTRRINLPESEPLLRPNAERRPWRGYARVLVSLVLLLTFLHSVVLSAPSPRRATTPGDHPVLCAGDNAETLPDYPADPCPEPCQNAPDEEGDSGETAEPDKDFLADQTTLPHFHLFLLNQLVYGELTPLRFCSPLPGFSPPPERVA
ncbi:MAG: hypothetical protein ICV83_14580 [Cytophagales bacterium]|nr:hypothetical protein [Cytophagales bacterium]